jgi:hypothetical protein
VAVPPSLTHTTGRRGTSVLDDIAALACELANCKNVAAGRSRSGVAALANAPRALSNLDMAGASEWGQRPVIHWTVLNQPSDDTRFLLRGHLSSPFV